MTKEQIFEKIDDVYSDHDGGVIYLSEDRMNQIKEVIQQAINFIPCCTEFKCGEERVFNEEKCSEQCSQCKEDYSEDI